MKKILSLLLLVILAMPASAVLKEKDLARTLGVLRAELEQTYKQQKATMARLEGNAQMQHAQLVDYMQRSEQISLMIYSQGQDFTFDVAYACQQATDLHKQLKSNNLPYATIANRIRMEVERYNGLIKSLEELPPAVGKAANTQVDSLLTEMADSVMNNVDDIKQPMPLVEEKKITTYVLDEQQQKDRDKCLLYAKAIRNNMLRILNTITEDKSYYDAVNERVDSLNAYAQHRYNIIQEKIFRNGGDNYLTVLQKLPRTIYTLRNEVNKYAPLENRSSVYSQWRGPVVGFICIMLIFYILIATLISNILVRWIVPFVARRLHKNTEDLLDGIFVGAKRKALLFALGMFIFAISIMIIHNVVAHNYFVVMATGLASLVAWLALVIFVSLLIRLEDNQMKICGKLYVPFIIMAFIVIFFRIILIPNNLVNLIYPPLLIGFTIWQARIVRRTNKQARNSVKIPTADFFYSIVSLLTMVAATSVALYGYVLLAVEIMMWWMFQLAFIQTITCVYDLLKRYEKVYLLNNIREEINKENISHTTLLKNVRSGKYIQYTWMFDLINRAAVPIVAVVSTVFSIYLAADVFEMRNVCMEAFGVDFINQPNLIQISIDKLVLVVASYFGFRYLNYATTNLYRLYKKKNSKAGEQHNFTLANNIIAILLWGSYFMFALVVFKVPKTGLAVVGGGLATGMGFAMKDLLENFFYGISLMAGRVRVGDYIECDGIFGKVDTITYQSTQIITLDGSVIAFLNSALFTKNFKNLTRNHNYELIKVPIGVAYGSNVQKVREMLIEAITPLNEKTEDGRQLLKKDSEVGVIFSGFGDNSVDLLVTFWVLVDQKGAFTARVREVIYNTLNDNRIEIPFPQRDVHIINPQ